MNENDVTSQKDVWERSSWLWTAVYYLNIALTLAISSGNHEAAQARILLLGAALGLWHAIIFVAWLRWKLYDRSALMAPLVAVEIILWFFLVQADPTFYFLLGTIFPFIYIFLSLPWAITMTLLINGLAAYDNFRTAGPSSNSRSLALWYWLGFSALSILLGGWIYAIIRQSMQRRQLIQQLQQAQAELAAAERREGMMQERERLSREIHDTLAQGFTSIVMHLEAADQALPADPARLRHHLSQARETARASLEQARRVVADLRPDLLEQQSLPDALRRTAGRWSEETGISVITAVTGTILPLHPQMDVTLLRAAQEALANVRKHAQATEVSLTLSYMGDAVVLDVQDNGVGVKSAGVNAAALSPFSSGFGLTGMRERVRQFHGTVELESEPGEGTTLVVSLPVEQKAETGLGDLRWT